MGKSISIKMCLITGLFMCFLGSINSFAQEIPHLEKRGNATQLIVDGKPFLILGGELHNSSSSSLAYLDTLWLPLKQMNLNTVLAAVSWEQIEPTEGTFDFTLVDGMLKGAREHQLKLVLLWFGSWKNGLSHYTPLWVKQDYKRFPRIILENGKPNETLSALNSESAKADAKAFAALMRHLSEVDKQNRTFIMVQVENEVGVIGGARDYSAMANAEFAKSVPSELMNELKSNSSGLQSELVKKWSEAGSKKSGSWAEVFGATPFADEAFMAWQYAKYLNTVAKAGKAVYDIPMFVNAWIVQPEDKRPGDYPAGGPQSHVHDIWRMAAPAIDIKAPDIYLPDFKGITAMYHHSWNPLFIPESFSGKKGAANSFYAIGKHAAIGYSPFGIDNWVENPSQTPIAKAYRVLSQLSPVITEAQSKNTICAVSLDKMDSVQTIELGGYKIGVSLRKNWNGVAQTDNGYGLIINSEKDEFIVAGSDLNFTFIPISSGPKMAGLASVYEGEYVNGAWKAGRLLNGDDVMLSYKLADEAAVNRTGSGVKLRSNPGILRIKLYRFE